MKAITALARSALQIGGALVASYGAQTGYLDPTTAGNLANATANGHVSTANAIPLVAGILSSVVGALWSQHVAAKAANANAALSAVGIEPTVAEKAPALAVQNALADPTAPVMQTSAARVKI